MTCGCEEKQSSMAGKSIRLLLFVLSFFATQPLELVFSTRISSGSCSETERKSLLEFKQGLKDLGNRLSSWVGDDCCSWQGISCNNLTGAVVHLDLGKRNSPDSGPLQGKISPSLLGLKHLTYLDLSFNQFEGASIPSFIGFFKELRYLNLSDAGFGGVVPHELGNLSSLQYLDLSGSDNELSVDDCQWVALLHSLQQLDMGGVYVGKVAYCLEALNMLPSIGEIRLSHCGPGNVPRSLLQVNFTSLSVLDLSGNNISSTIPDWIFNISSLQVLALSDNKFSGPVPAAIQNMASLKALNLSGNSDVDDRMLEGLGALCGLRRLSLSSTSIGRNITKLGEFFSGCIRNSLEELDLSYSQLHGDLPYWLRELKNLKYLHLRGNSLFGSIPSFLGSLSLLQELDLSNNEFNGTVAESLGQLWKLESLDISDNSLNGVLSESHFVNLTRLKFLDMSSNSLVLKVSTLWLPPFQLEYIMMSSCRLGPSFPAWLRTQVNCVQLSLSNTGIADTIPDWFWNFSSQINSIDLSYNAIHGMVPTSLTFASTSLLNLSSNYLEGPLPNFWPNFNIVDLSNNSFSGPIPPIDSVKSLVMFLSLSMNNINGSIPSSICKADLLVVIDLSENHFIGDIPSCLWLALVVLDLSSNNLSGSIPDSISYSFALTSLRLNNNQLSGDFPMALGFLVNLVILDLSDNKFDGNVPSWIGDNRQFLKILNLRSNMFVGEIPFQLSHLPLLQILDLSHNNLSGAIPQSFGNFTGMKVANKKDGGFVQNFYGYTDTIFLLIKGSELKYDKLLPYVTVMDLSCNSLSEMIPEELANLAGLLSLNLSGNHLSGEITQNIGGLRQLQSLDLSRNELSGAIPPSLTELTFLSALNLSYNNLSGRIPTGNQLQTFVDPSIYVGNHDLCGFPLSASCPQVPNVAEHDDRDEHDGVDEWLWLYISVVLGFIIGFWAVFGVLIFKKKWRDVYFQFIDNIFYQVYVMVVVNVAKLQVKRNSSRT